MSMSSNDLLVNFHDAVLYESDLELLRETHAWLNDACILFYLQVLQQKDLPVDSSFFNSKDETRAHASNALDKSKRGDRLTKKISFVDPSVLTFLMFQCDEEDLSDFARSFHVPTHVLVVPINDSHCVSSSAWKQAGSGSHWSLLVVYFCASHASEDNKTNHVPKLKFWHLDSVRNSDNIRAANSAAAVLQSMIVQSFSELETPKSPTTPQPRVEPLNTPLQFNGYDCGLHCLAAAETVYQILAEEPGERDVIYGEEVDSASSTRSDAERFSAVLVSRLASNVSTTASFGSFMRRTILDAAKEEIRHYQQRKKVVKTSMS